MMPASTRRLAVAACALILLWFCAWLGASWTLEMPTAGQPAPFALPPAAAGAPPATRMPDSAPLLQSPAFYPDRRPHPFRPGMVETPVSQPSGFGYELTTTVVGKRQAFAMLRPPGSRQSFIARPGEAFTGDPAWHVAGIDRHSIRLTGSQGRTVELQLKPPVPTQPPTSAPPPMPASPSASSGTDSQSFLTLPAPAIQPAQGDAELRARIEARRREAASNAYVDGTQ